jgi:hypothetical protein
VLLVANAVVGFREEYQAGNAIAALKEKLALHARVRREGKWTLSIVIFNFYPVIAVMLELLALLNDGAILSIAYDKVRYSNEVMGPDEEALTEHIL